MNYGQLCLMSDFVNNHEFRRPRLRGKLLPLALTERLQPVEVGGKVPGGREWSPSHQTIEWSRPQRASFPHVSTVTGVQRKSVEEAIDTDSCRRWCGRQLHHRHW
jgi:hypothetical protein